MKRKNIIGIDASLSECRKEGYLMLQKEGKFSPTKYYRVFAYYPEYTIEESDGQITKDSFMTDTTISATEAIQRYEDHKEGIDKFTGTSHSTDPSEYGYDMLLSLVSAIDPYCGLS